VIVVPSRVAEHVIRRRPFGARVRYRVDLHGVSSFGPRDAKALVRWEWIESMAVDEGRLVVTSATEAVEIPDGAFGLSPEDLRDRLERARSITERPEVIAELGAGAA